MAHNNKLNASKFGSLGVIQEMIIDLRLYCHNLTIAYWFLYCDYLHDTTTTTTTTTTATTIIIIQKYFSLH